MAYLGNPVRTMAVLERFGFTVQKKYGQNFLVDANILEEIMDAAQIGPEDFVLEIGPGIGTMTQYLCERARRVIAVEIDEKLLPVLDSTLSEYDNVRVLNQDILKVDLGKLVAEENDGKPIKVVANLPYYITTPIVMELLGENLPVESITIMIQKEVAARMQAGPGSKDYGALSLAVQYYSQPRVIATVSPGCFLPPPNVDSAVIQLDLCPPPIQVKSEKFLFQVIRASFNQRRKTLANGLKNDPNIPVSREKIEETIAEMGLAPTIRGEVLTLEEFGELSNRLYDKR